MKHAFLLALIELLNAIAIKLLLTSFAIPFPLLLLAVPHGVVAILLTVVFRPSVATLMSFSGPGLCTSLYLALLQFCASLCCFFSLNYLSIGAFALLFGLMRAMASALVERLLLKAALADPVMDGVTVVAGGAILATAASSGWCPTVGLLWGSIAVFFSVLFSFVGPRLLQRFGQPLVSTSVFTHALMALVLTGLSFLFRELNGFSANLQALHAQADPSFTCLAFLFVGAQTIVSILPILQRKSDWVGSSSLLSAALASVTVAPIAVGLGQMVLPNEDPLTFRRLMGVLVAAGGAFYGILHCYSKGSDRVGGSSMEDALRLTKKKDPEGMSADGEPVASASSVVSMRRTAFSTGYQPTPLAPDAISGPHHQMGSPQSDLVTKNADGSGGSCHVLALMFVLLLWAMAHASEPSTIDQVCDPAVSTGVIIYPSPPSPPANSDESGIIHRVGVGTDKPYPLLREAIRTLNVGTAALSSSSHSSSLLDRKLLGLSKGDSGPLPDFSCKNIQLLVFFIILTLIHLFAMICLAFV